MKHMRQVKVWVGLGGLLIVAVIVAVAVQQPLLMLPALCLWNPVVFILGFTSARSGVKFRNPIQYENIN